MALEIERKFLVGNGGWRHDVETSRRMVQAYLALDGGVSVRIRITDDKSARLTIKLSQASLVREEFEYPIPLADARQMIVACHRRLIEKIRHTISYEGFVWEVDVYEGELAGLVIAEVELQSESDDPSLPPWLGREVTGDGTWSNATLAVKGLPESVHA